MNIDSNHNNAGEDLGLGMSGMSGSGNSLGTFEALENPQLDQQMMIGNYDRADVQSIESKKGRN